MPADIRDYAPPPITNLRKRLVEKQLERVARFEKRAATLQAERTTSLSSLEKQYNLAQLENIKDARQRLRDSLRTIELQDEAARKSEADLKRLTPLQRTRRRVGLWRSSNDRNLAILGILERERRQNAPLTREAYARAKAIAASRKRYDKNASSLRGSRGYAYSVHNWELASPEVDPCVEWLIRQSVRREVLFARKQNKGHRSFHRRSPC